MRFWLLSAILRPGREKGDATRVRTDRRLDAILDWEFSHTCPP